MYIYVHIYIYTCIYVYIYYSFACICDSLLWQGFATLLARGALACGQPGQQVSMAALPRYIDMV